MLKVTQQGSGIKVPELKVKYKASLIHNLSFFSFSLFFRFMSVGVIDECLLGKYLDICTQIVMSSSSSPLSKRLALACRSHLKCFPQEAHQKDLMETQLEVNISFRL